MGRYTAMPAALLALLLTAACSGNNQDDGGSTASSPHRSIERPSGTADADSSGSARNPKLALPEGAEILVPVTAGTGNSDLPAFKPVTDVYTVYATCTGEGRMSIIDRDNVKDDPSRIGCNGPLTIGRVYTDITVKNLSVRIDGADTDWSLAIVSGEHSM